MNSMVRQGWLSETVDHITLKVNLLIETQTASQTFSSLRIFVHQQMDGAAAVTRQRGVHGTRNGRR